MTTPAMTDRAKPAELCKRGFIRVTCFIDWNSQLILSGVDPQQHPVEAAGAAIKQTTKRISNCLAKVNGSANFQVVLRLYHGWRKGYEPSANLRALRKVLAETDFSTLSDKPSVVYSTNIGFGDCLISALPKRMHQREGIHLPNTLRDRGAQGHEEKMVDTALASDLIVTAFRDPDEWILLVAEDDDLIPPLFTAESIVSPHSAKALLLSKRKRGKKFLLLDGLEQS